VQTLETLTLGNAPVRYAAAANRIGRNWGRIRRGDNDEGGSIGVGDFREIWAWV